MNGATVNNSTLTGNLLSYGDTSTLNQITVDENGTLDIQAHAIAQGTISIDGMVTVQSNKWLYNESAEDAVALSGTGTLNLSGEGTSGYLGTAENRGAFMIGKDLTVTTLGYSMGYVYANLTNTGTHTFPEASFQSDHSIRRTPVVHDYRSTNARQQQVVPSHRRPEAHAYCPSTQQLPHRQRPWLSPSVAACIQRQTGTGGWRGHVCAQAVVCRQRVG